MADTPQKPPGSTSQIPGPIPVRPAVRPPSEGRVTTVKSSPIAPSTPVSPPTLTTPPEPTVAAPPQLPPIVAPVAKDNLAQLMESLKEMDRLRSLESRLKLVVLTVPNGGTAQCQTYAKIEDVVAALVPLLGSDTQAFIFTGEQWGITKGPVKFLVAPDGKRIPLSQTPEDLEVDPLGSLSNLPSREDAILEGRTS